MTEMTQGKTGTGHGQVEGRLMRPVSGLSSQKEVSRCQPSMGCVEDRIEEEVRVVR